MVVSVSAAIACFLHFPAIDQIWSSPIKAIFSSLLLAAALLIFHYRERLPRIARLAVFACLALVIAAAGLQAIHLVEMRARTVPEWDVRVFWIYGQLMAKGENVYALEPYQKFYQELQPSRDFIEAVLQVGGEYPPPTMLLFRPLGYCTMPQAFLYWYIFLGLTVLVAIVLLRHTFLKRDGPWGLALILLLLFALGGTWETIRFGQTSFLTLIFLLLYWLDREHPRAGVWIVLGAIVKPYMAILLFDALWNKQWRAAIWCAVTGVVMSAASLLLLGPRTFISYFTLDPPGRVPRWVYMEWVNQSLLATILRLSHAPVAHSPAANPIFLMSVLVLFLTTAWLVVRAGRETTLSLCLWLLLGLMIYPGTLAHYSVMLLPILLLLWQTREKIPLGVFGCTALVTVVIALVGFHAEAFAAYFVTWIALAGLAITARPEGHAIWMVEGYPTAG
ncbi:MAG TPA: glycosyltransferase family 87 protein [Terriglobales bacterium]|nr:glycosyltransferase family 87 protein [Terriglobales bacterium]